MDGRFGVYHIQLHATQKAFAFIVMANVASLRGITRKYDLKGSLYNRSARSDTQNHSSPSGALLDQDLIDDMKCGKAIRLKLQDKRRLLLQLAQDVLFLARMAVIDYSMLVCEWRPPSSPGSPMKQDQGPDSKDCRKEDCWEHCEPMESRHHNLHAFEGASCQGEWYLLGIIDLSREYGCMELLEQWYKTKLRGQQQVAVTVGSPYFYAERFLQKMNLYLQPQLELDDPAMQEVCSLFRSQAPKAFQDLAMLSDMGHDRPVSSQDSTYIEYRGPI